MEAWLSIVLRQMVLYSLPVLVSLTLACWLEARMTGKRVPGPFHAVAWPATWLPWLASIVMHRGLIIALPQPVTAGWYPALARLFAHLLLGAVGFLLYAWSLRHPPLTGLPPLHHWWAKVLMFFNLCMVVMHLLPAPGMLVGEVMAARWPRLAGMRLWHRPGMVWLFVLLAASPLLDWLLGGLLVYPIYAWLSGVAMAWQ